MGNRPIGVFDSGVGGLTVLVELQTQLPKESFIYIADQKYIPYGTKSRSTVKARALALATFLEEKNVKIIVVACNTATVIAIDALRKECPVPIIGIVPVIKTAAEKTKTKKIAVFATPATTKSAYLTRLIKKFADGAYVYKNGATRLEDLIETGDLTNPKIERILKKHLLLLKKAGVDVIALGCTHYPFLKDRMQKIVGKNILILDSGGAAARQTKRVLEEEEIKALSLAKKSKDWYYTTGDASAFQNVVKKLLGKKIHAVHIDL
ncbi:MAG: glutamate racemase [Candidatus Levyibacteriota bacterium]